MREFSDTEVSQIIDQISKTKGNGEWEDIEFKQCLCFEDTGSNKNTTQRAISALANTRGGLLIVGVSDKGDIVGVNFMADIENHISRKLSKKIRPHVPEFKVNTFEKDGKLILYLTIQRIREPLQCDNGVFYYRNQSETLSMSYSMIEKRFRRIFDEEKYVYLVQQELVDLFSYLGFVRNNPDWRIRLSHYTQNLRDSQNYLYDFYKRSNLLQMYERLIERVRFYIAREGVPAKEMSGGQFLQEKVKAFQTQLSESVEKEGILTNI